MIHHPGAQPHGYVSILIPRGVDWFCLAGMGRFWKAPKAQHHANAELTRGPPHVAFGHRCAGPSDFWRIDREIN
jgi:hypothetical protein